MNQDTEHQPTRAERDLPAARRAAERARAIWWDEQKPTHCFGCGAELPVCALAGHEPACPSRPVTCPDLTCGAEFPANSVREAWEHFLRSHTYTPLQATPSCPLRWPLGTGPQIYQLQWADDSKEWRLPRSGHYKNIIVQGATKESGSHHVDDMFMLSFLALKNHLHLWSWHLGQGNMHLRIKFHGGRRQVVLKLGNKNCFKYFLMLCETGVVGDLSIVPARPPSRCDPASEGQPGDGPAERPRAVRPQQQREALLQHRHRALRRGREESKLKGNYCVMMTKNLNFDDKASKSTAQVKKILWHYRQCKYVYTLYCVKRNVRIF